LEEIDLTGIQFVIAMSKKVRTCLIESYEIPPSRIKELYVDDPFGDDLSAHEKCAQNICGGLGKLSFDN